MDASVATEARGIADELDAAAWTAQEADDEASYFRLFRRARAASALALGGEYGDAIYEAAYAFEAPEDLLRLLRDVPDDQPT